MTWIPAWQRRCGDSSCTYCLPETLTGEVGNVVAVNATEDGYELITPSGTGTVTSVAIAPTDGLEVDSGSPVTSAGTIALGVNASNLRSHINVENGADVTDTANVVSSLSGASLTGVTVATDDKVLIQDSSNGDALRTVTTQSIANLVTAPSGSYIHRGINKGSDTAAGGVTTSYVTYATVTATSTGGLIIIDCSMIFNNASSGSDRGASYRVQMDGSTVGDLAGVILVPLTPTNLPIHFSESFTHTPSAGSHTWTLQCLASNGVSVTLRRPTIKVYEVSP